MNLHPSVPAAPRLAASRVPCFRVLDLVVDGLPAEEAVLEIEHGLTDDVAPARTLLAAPLRATWALTVEGPDPWVSHLLVVGATWLVARRPGPRSTPVRRATPAPHPEV